MAIEIGALRAVLSLDSAAFEKGAKRAEAAMNGVQRRLAGMGRRMSAFGRDMSLKVSLPMAGAAGLAVRSSLQTVDAQAKLAQSLGTTVVSMQNLSRAAELAGVPVSGLEQLSKDLTRRLSQAAEGTGPASKALDQLGLSATDLLALPLDQRIAMINDRIAEFVPAAQQAAVAGKLFGEEGSIAASRLDAATIAKAAAEVEKYGVAVSEVDADKIEEANDAISALGLVTTGLANQITVALAPALTSIAERIAEVSGWFSQLGPETQTYIGIAAGIAAAVGPAAIALGLLATGLAAVATPIGLVVVGIAGLTAAAVAFWPEINKAKDSLIQFGTQGVDWIKTKFEGLLTFFATLPERMVQIGSDLIEGLKRGILAKWESVKSSVLGVAKSVENVFTGWFETNSPSKLFKRIGGWLMEGLGIGVTEGEAMARGPLQGAADRISGAMDGVGNSFDATGQRFGDMVAGILSGATSAGDALSQLGDRLFSKGFSSLANSVADSLGLGGLFGGLFSFDGGGFTGSGSRSGGVDGRGGFPAILHPNETVIDHTRGGSLAMQGGGFGGRATLHIIAPDGFSVQQEGQIAGIAVQVTQAGIGQFVQRGLPQAVDRINKDPRRRG